jgi:hypothetical protein
MGNYLPTITAEVKPVDLCDDIINDQDDILIIVRLYAFNPINDTPTQKILEYLQYTNPTLCYMFKSTIYLVYDQSKNPPFLRSNVASDVISHLSSELTMFIVKNTSINLRMMNVHVSTADYALLLKQTNTFMSMSNFKGTVYEPYTYQEGK